MVKNNNNKIQSNKKYWEKFAQAYDKGVEEDGDIRHRLVINPIVFKFLGDLKNKIDQMYHHTLEDYLNAFSNANLFIQKTTEPNNEEILHNKERIHTPMFLIWKMKKL